MPNEIELLCKIADRLDSISVSLDSIDSQLGQLIQKAEDVDVLEEEEDEEEDSVWFCVPSCRPKREAEDCFRRWKALGYKIAILRQGEPIDSDLVDVQISTGEYLGWPNSTNFLCKRVLADDASIRWGVGGGDDYWPISDRWAANVGFECFEYFDGTFGVMQPTGDRWGDNESSRITFGQDRGAILDRVAGSPWMGREWIERSYQGNGPMFDGYRHLYADEELQCVAEKLGVFWQRRDLVQYHNHPAREKGFGVYNQGYLKDLYSKEAWKKERALFESRKAAGFPGSEPL